MQHAHVTTGQFQRRYDIRDREQGAEHRWPVLTMASQGLRVPEVVHFVLQRQAGSESDGEVRPHRFTCCVGVGRPP